MLVLLSGNCFFKKGEEYSNGQYGFKIKSPAGWYVHRDPNPKTLVFINQSKDDPKGLPSIGVSIDNYVKGESSVKDFAQRVMNIYKKRSFTVGDMSEKQAGDLKGATFVIESPKGMKGYSLKLKQYVFEKDKKIISVMFMSKSDDYDKNIGAFEKAVSSLNYYEAPKVTKYSNKSPAFQIEIPGKISGWRIIARKDDFKPFLLMKDGGEDLPFIDTNVSFSKNAADEIKKIWSDPKKLLESKKSFDMQYEKKILPDVEFVKDKIMKLSGLSALNRVYRSKKTKTTYHSVTIAFKDALVDIGLNSYTKDYEKDKKDFISIIKSIKVKN